MASRKVTLILMLEVEGSIPSDKIFSLVIGRGVVGRASCCFGWVVWARVGNFARVEWVSSSISGRRGDLSAGGREFNSSK